MPRSVLISALTITVVGPELPLGAGPTRHGSLCFCGRGVPYNTMRCVDCGYEVPWMREARRREQAADELGIRPR